MCYYDLVAQNNACMSQYGSKTITYSYNNGIKTISTEMNDHKLWRNSVCYVDSYDCKMCIDPLDGGMEHCDDVSATYGFSFNSYYGLLLDTSVKSFAETFRMVCWIEYMGKTTYY